ncbi:hypothetical protein GCM10017750_00080 [Streptomyces racemochromogenes]
MTGEEICPTSAGFTGTGRRLSAGQLLRRTAGGRSAVCDIGHVERADSGDVAQKTDAKLAVEEVVHPACEVL